jgi:hypothetical protein
MWWKIYFGITIVEAILGTASIFIAPGIHIFSQIIYAVIFLVAVVGLYGYIFRKDILNPVFWQYFLGIYILIDVLYFIYAAAPHASFISSLSFMAINPINNLSLVSTIIGVAIDIPLLYALYRLTKGELYEPKPKKKEKVFRWGMIQTAFWGYASILTLFLFILAFFPGSGSGKNVDPTDSFYTSFMFAPLLIFWLWVVFEYKQYKWNWWRTTLVANALLYSGSIIFSAFVPQTSQSTSGVDFIALLQLLILLISLYVFGRDQFKRQEKSHEKKILT